MILSAPKDDNGGGDNELSDYMRARAENIARHNARLRKLGLISILEEKRSNAAALGQNVKPNDTKESSQCPQEKKKTKKRNRMNADIVALPSRKSLRLQGIEADIDSMKKSPIDIDDEEGSSIEKERQERVKECREVRLRAAKAIADAGAEQAAKENPTATYEHCLMRVKTMTDKGLKNRVKAIERAAGRHCVVKMAIFKSCLQDEDMWELAQEASDALERLKALQPPPE